MGMMHRLLAEIRIPAWAIEYPWIAPALIVALGLFVYGIGDVLRLSPTRIWAISGVCFRDAIRRRVLWITPLAMLGVIIVSQLQHPRDEPDAIRQTIQFSFFASAFVVTIIALITAATNLPREIENRVVFTIVTKPVTRLEIVLGKITGFGRVSFMMLLIMGLFTLGYLHLRAWSLGNQISQTLEEPNLGAAQREWLQHFQSEGLLTAKKISRPRALSQYARMPDAKTGRWMLGGAQDSLFRFKVEPGNLTNPTGTNDQFQAFFAFKIPFERIAPVEADAADEPPKVIVLIMDRTGTKVIATAQQLAMKGNETPEQLENIHPADAALDGKSRIPIPVNVARQMELSGEVIVQLIGMSQQHVYGISREAVTIAIENPKLNVAFDLVPAADPMTRGSLSNAGQQLKGPERGLQPVALFAFRDAAVQTPADGKVPFELRVGVDNRDYENTSDIATVVEVSVYDWNNRKMSPPTLVYPENLLTSFFSLPAEYMTSGNFDVLVRNRTTGSTIDVAESSVLMITDRQPFAFNLFKGLFVLWLFALLVSIVAFFCSTFLSWPIAVVLTLIIILGRWAAMSLDVGSGLGAQFAQEFTSDPSTGTVVNRSIEALVQGLTLISMVLPDISSFGITEQIQRGSTISFRQVLDPIMVIVMYGLPLTTLAYVFLRNKEIAP